MPKDSDIPNREILMVSYKCEHCGRGLDISCYRDTFHASDLDALFMSHNCVPFDLLEPEIRRRFDAGFGVLRSDVELYLITNEEG